MRLQSTADLPATVERALARLQRGAGRGRAGSAPGLAGAAVRPRGGGAAGGPLRVVAAHLAPPAGEAALPGPLELFRRARTAGEPAFLWWPAGGRPLVAAGTAAELDAVDLADLPGSWQRLLAGWEGPAPPVAVGGLAFDPSRPADSLWQGFPRLWLAVPRVLATWERGRARLLLAARAAGGASRPREAELLRTAALARRLLAAQPAGPAPSRVRPALAAAAPAPSAGTNPDPAGTLAAAAVGAPAPDEPAAGWHGRVREALAAIAAGRLRKVVLARRVPLRVPGALEPEPVLGRLAEASAPGTVVFALAWGGRCFLGATPERLLSLAGCRVEVECLAGTAPRGATADEDARLARALLRSTKDLAEHALVVDAVRAALADRAVRVRVPGRPALRRLPHLQHLCTRVRAELPPGADPARAALELLAALHPTPAVCGYPREEALAFLRRSEPFDRGWYAGPVGFLDARGRAEFALAIRSGLLWEGGAALYAGCGIVAGSDPQRELAETGWKLAALAQAIAGGTGA